MSADAIPIMLLAPFGRNVDRISAAPFLIWACC
jgi:hypothetical protein